MLKTLVRKQLFELNRGIYIDKKGRSRSKTSSLFVFLAIYVLLFLITIGGSFTAVSILLAKPLATAGYGWLYYLVMTGIALVLGIFSSSFNTFAVLYNAKDNETLLSMPIKTSDIVLSRIIGIYIFSLFFTGMVILPAVIVYAVILKSVYALVAGLIFGFAITVLVMVLSCILGYLVARISKIVKNKSFATVLATLLFVVVYYVVYFKAQVAIRNLVKNFATVGERVKDSSYLLYFIGKAATGDIIPLLAVLAVVALLAYITYSFIEKSFIKVTTTADRQTKKEVRKENMAAKKLSSTLFGRELSRFVSSPTYMLNCSFGVLLYLALSVVVLVKSKDISTLVLSFNFAKRYLPLIVSGLLCLISVMNSVTAPSISMEGKSVWVALSMPIDIKKIFKAKVKLNMVLTLIPLAICIFCILIVVPIKLYNVFLIVLTPSVFTWLIANFGLVANLKFPNLDWTNESTAVKQGMAPVIETFGSWLYIAALATLYILARKMISVGVFLVLVNVLNILISLALRKWIMTKGKEIYENLA